MKVFSKNEVAAAASWLREGKLLAFPTETVYGIGCIYDDEQAYNELVRLKNRPEEKPFSMMFGELHDVFAYVDNDLRGRLVLDRFLPGEVTFLLPKKGDLPRFVDHGTGVIGIRVPDDEFVSALIKAVGKPLLVTSCNRSGEAPALSSVEAINYFSNEDVGFVEGESAHAMPTTVVDLSTKGKIKPVRVGNLSFRELEESFNKKIVLALGSDHAGYKYKEAIKKHLKDLGYEVKDCGTDSEASVDYPSFAFKAAKEVSNGKADYGILVCSSGEGIAIAANKVKGIRCGIGYNDDVSRLMREHNRANMIAFGANFMSLEDVIRRTDIFLSSHFMRGRHQRRVGEIIDFENQ